MAGASTTGCNAHGLYCVPLYDTLGAGAMEFVIRHVEVSIASAKEKKISEIYNVIKEGGITSNERRSDWEDGVVTPQRSSPAC